MEHNKFKITGRKECLQQLKAKSGKPMGRFLQVVDQHKLGIAVFGKLVAMFNVPGEGKLVGVICKASISSLQIDVGIWCQASAANWSGP